MTNSRTNSRSIGSRTRRFAIAIAACAAAVLATAGVAHAGRRRVVVLDFAGPRSERFHDDLVRLIKKTHTVVPAEKWYGTAEQLDAGTRSARDMKKVARKLKIDAIVEGKIEKRRDEFIIRLRLHEGRSGHRIGDAIATKAEGPGIDGQAKRDLEDELIGAIGTVELNHISGGNRSGNDEEGDEDAEDEGGRRPARTGSSGRGGDEAGKKGKRPDEKPRKRGSRAADAGDGEDRPARPRAVAAAGDDAAGDDAAGDDAAEDDAAEDDAAEDDAAEDDTEDGAHAGTGARPLLSPAAARSPGERALDAVLGLSATMRRMTFSASPMLQAQPPSYRGKPVAGALLDATLYPLALGHDRGDPLENLGLTLVYDRVIQLSSKDPVTGMAYSTIESRLWLAAVFRHAFGDTPAAPVVLGSLGYGRQRFNILGKVELPDVKYAILAPGAGLRFPVTSKLILGADVKLLLVHSAGPIEDPDQYGDARALGFEGAVSLDYRITARIFARAQLRAETIGLTFEGTGTQSNARDGMPETQDVTGARDSYFAGMAAIGYLYQ